MKTITINRTDGTIIASREAKNLTALLERLVDEGASLACANLEHANLVAANLSEANLTRGSLVGSNLRAANLKGAALVYVDLSGANLSDADLSGANLVGADLTITNLEGASFARANLEGAYLANANLKDAKLNWNSHDLLSELLWRAADTPEREQFAAWIGRKTDWCWGKFLDCGHDEIDWALNVFAAHGNLDGAPAIVTAIASKKKGSKASKKKGSKASKKKGSKASKKKGSD